MCDKNRDVFPNYIFLLLLVTGYKSNPEPTEKLYVKKLNRGGSRGCPGCPPALLIREGSLFEKNSVNKYHRECIKTDHFDIRNTKIFWGWGTTRGASFR